jgi:hypothetical protein
MAGGSMMDKTTIIMGSYSDGRDGAQRGASPTLARNCSVRCESEPGYEQCWQGFAFTGKHPWPIPKRAKFGSSRGGFQCHELKHSVSTGRLGAC